MRLGEKTIVLTFQKNPLRETDLSTHLFVVTGPVLVNLRICPFDSHMCSKMATGQI